MKNLNRLSAALAFATIVCAQTKPKDIYGWTKIKWGMSVEQAKAALGEQASYPPKVLSDGLSSYIGRLVINNVRMGEVEMKAIVQTRVQSDAVAAVTIETVPKFTDRTADRAAKYAALRALLVKLEWTPILRQPVNP